MYGTIVRKSLQSSGNQNLHKLGKLFFLGLRFTANGTAPVIRSDLNLKQKTCEDKKNHNLEGLL